MGAKNKKFSVHYKLNIFLLASIIFTSQLIISPPFIEPSNVSKALFFCFITLLFLTVYPPKKINIYAVDFFLLTALLFLILINFIISNKPYPFLVVTFIISLVLYRLKFEGVFKNYIYSGQVFLRYFSVFVTIVALLGVYEYFSFFLYGKSTLPLIPYLLPPDLNYRISGIYGQPNFTALLLVTGLLVLFYLYLHDNHFKTFQFRFLRYLPFLVVGVSFFLTGSRAGQLAMVLTVLPLCLLVSQRIYLHREPIKRRQFIVLCLLLVVSYVISYSLNLYFSVQGVRSLGTIGVSTDTRFVLWTAAVLMFLDHPWLGIGLGNYQFILPQYVNSAHSLLGFVEFEAMAYTAWAHNEFLQLLSEGGMLVFIALVGALACLFYPLFVCFKGKHREWSPMKLYSHFFILPFVVQSMFSWPMRYAPLLILFVTFGVLLASQYKGSSFDLSRVHTGLVRLLCFCGLIFTLFFVYQEFRMGHVVKQIKYNSVHASFLGFEKLVSTSYAEYPLLMEAVPLYVKAAVENSDKQIAEKVLPYVERLTQLHGAHWQWFYLAHVYLLLDRRDDAMASVTRSINLWPTKEEYWSFQHYLNMLNASEKTGRPLDDFLPIQPGQTTNELREKFDFVKRFKIYK